jgi:hypothetical protein
LEIGEPEKLIDMKTVTNKDLIKDIEEALEY